MGFLLYVLDRSVMDGRFAEMGEKGWENLAKASEHTPVSPYQRTARRRFYAAYGLPEFANPIKPDAARDFLMACREGRMPDWVIAAAANHMSDIRDAAKER